MFCTAATLVQDATSFQDYGNNLLTGLPALSAFSLTVFQFILNIARMTLLTWIKSC